MCIKPLFVISGSLCKTDVSISLFHFPQIQFAQFQGVMEMEVVEPTNDLTQQQHVDCK